MARTDFCVILHGAIRAEMDSLVIKRSYLTAHEIRFGNLLSYRKFQRAAACSAASRRNGDRAQHTL